MFAKSKILQRKTTAPFASVSSLGASVVTPETDNRDILRNDISPLLTRRRTPGPDRKRRSQEAELLTRSPYKAKLQTVAEKKGNTKKSVAIEKQRRKRTKSTTTRVRKSVRNATASSGTSTYCTVCGEDFDEDRTQCRTCKGRTHENCADLNNDLYFYTATIVDELPRQISYIDNYQ